jgi:hypothetical protein
MKQDLKTSVMEEIKEENLQEQVLQENVMNDPLMQNMQQENVAANMQIQGEEEKFSDYIARKKAQLPDLYTFHESRSQKDVRAAAEDTRARIRQLQSNKSASYAELRALETENFKNISSRLIYDKKWYSAFNKESGEMSRVKDTVIFLNNFLESPIKKYFTGEGERRVFDGNAMKTDMDTAFDDTIKACNEYIEAKRAQGEKTKSSGVRRLEKVKEMLDLCEQEKLKYSFLIESIKTRALEKYDDATIEQKTPKELTTMHLTAEATKSVWQNQGNSTDVYMINVMEDGEEKTYYIKENLPLISSDLEGFIDRRIAQLQVSGEKIGTGDEELRMKKAGMKAEDYAVALSLLTEMKKELASATGAEKVKVRDRLIKFFSHDFDKMFREMDIHNRAAKALEENGGDDGFDLKHWQDIANDKRHQMRDVAQYILNLYGSNKDKQKAEEENQKPFIIIPKDAYQWIKEKMRLTEKSDGSLLKILKQIHGKKNDKRVEDLFRISLGKEVELFGQMRDRMAGDDREVAAANNTATHVLSEMSGFSDVVTGSRTKVVRFKNREGKMVESFCTVIDEAQGDEFIELQKKAKKEGLKIEYSPNATRQLMRLQSFDTLCLQVDRHGRNFKCKSTKTFDGRIIITDIMSYDHDMSFSEETLSDAFKNPDSKTASDKEVKKKGFLPNPTTRLKKGSPEYNYVMKKYFNYSMPAFLDRKAEEPNWEKWQRKLRQSPGKLMEYFRGPFFVKGYMVEDAEIGGFELPKERPQYLTGNQYYGTVKDAKTGEPLSQDEQNELAERFRKTFVRIREMLLHNKSGNRSKIKFDQLKVDFSKEEWIEFTKLVGEMSDMAAEYDFSEVGHAQMINRGFIQLWLEEFNYVFLNAIKTNPEIMKARDQFVQYKGEESEEHKKAMETLTDKETGDLVIPTMLHYDADAYKSISDLTDPAMADMMEARLKSLNFRQSKIDALKKRAVEMKKQIDEAWKKAEAFYVLAGYKKDDVRSQFLLKKDDYAKLSSIEDLAVDPGNTYLSISNEKYLFGNSDFKNMLSDNDINAAFEEEKKKHHDSKLFDDKEYGTRNGKKDLFNNPMNGKITNFAA